MRKEAIDIIAKSIIAEIPLYLNATEEGFGADSFVVRKKAKDIEYEAAVDVDYENITDEHANDGMGYLDESYTETNIITASVLYVSGKINGIELTEEEEEEIITNVENSF